MGSWQHRGHSSEKDIVTLLNEVTILQDGLLSSPPLHPLPRLLHWQKAESQRWGRMLHILPRRRHSAPAYSDATLPLSCPHDNGWRQACVTAARTHSPSAFHPRCVLCLILLLLLTIWSSDLIYMTLEVTRTGWHDLHDTITLTAIWRMGGLRVTTLMGAGHQLLSTVIPSSDVNVSVHTRDDKGSGRNMVGDQSEKTEGRCDVKGRE